LFVSEALAPPGTRIRFVPIVSCLFLTLLALFCLLLHPIRLFLRLSLNSGSRLLILAQHSKIKPACPISELKTTTHTDLSPIKALKKTRSRPHFRQLILAHISAALICPSLYQFAIATSAFEPNSPSSPPTHVTQSRNDSLPHQVHEVPIAALPLLSSPSLYILNLLPPLLLMVLFCPLRHPTPSLISAERHQYPVSIG
jgi:hypothetical protein